MISAALTLLPTLGIIYGAGSQVISREQNQWRCDAVWTWTLRKPE